MSDNAARYGFRWVTGFDGGKPMPVIEERVVATGASFDVTAGAANVNLRKGDPLQLLSTGTVTLCPGAETTQVVPYGIYMGCRQYWDGSKLRLAQELLPSDISWGTNWERRTIVYVAPIAAGVWELDTDAAGGASFDTEAEYEAVVGENADFILKGASGELYANPRLSFSSHATTAGLMLRIVGISKTVENSDFSGNFVKILVAANRALRPQFTAAGEAGI